MKSLSKWILLILIAINIFATERIGRLGVGFTNEMKNGIPSLSFKLQKSKAFAFSGLFGIDTSDNGGWNSAIKLYRNLFDEPQLSFYSSLLAGAINKKTNGISDKTGFQFDIGLGSEFSFRGLESLGLSLEFGFSLNKIHEFAIQTKGSSFVVAAAHFYL